jgi:multidrug efflux pump subunit AcrA (membrane-fusion protein)
MRQLIIAGLALLAALSAGCNSEEQKKIDMQACSGYGFKPGTNEYAVCMMQTAQNRAAQQAANQRQQSYNDTVAQQAQKDRDAQAQAQQDAQNAAHQAEIQKMMTDTSIPTVTTPTIPSINTSNMNCTGSQGANAGSMTCTSN